MRDEAGRLRVDEHELQFHVQHEDQVRWRLNPDRNLHDVADFPGYRTDFPNLFGFGFDGIDRESKVDTPQTEVAL